MFQWLRKALCRHKDKELATWITSPTEWERVWFCRRCIKMFSCPEDGATIQGLEQTVLPEKLFRFAVEQNIKVLDIGGYLLLRPQGGIQ